MSNITLTIKRNTPLIQTCDDFLSHDECRLLINDDPNQESVYNKISNILNVDRSRLENIELIKYDLTNTCERQSIWHHMDTHHCVCRLLIKYEHKCANAHEHKHTCTYHTLLFLPCIALPYITHPT